MAGRAECTTSDKSAAVMGDASALKAGQGKGELLLRGGVCQDGRPPDAWGVEL